jgi:hypothetical protein
MGTRLDGTGVIGGVRRIVLPVQVRSTLYGAAKKYQGYIELWCHSQKLNNQLMRQRMGETEFYIYEPC